MATSQYLQDKPPQGINQVKKAARELKLVVLSSISFAGNVCCKLTGTVCANICQNYDLPQIYQNCLLQIFQKQIYQNDSGTICQNYFRKLATTLCPEIHSHSKYGFDAHMQQTPSRVLSQNCNICYNLCIFDMGVT
jgi:hypothetical protein